MSRSATTLQQAVTLHRAGQFVEAEVHYRRLLQSEPDHAEALQLLGTLLAQSGHLPDALEFLRRSLRQDERQSGAHANLAHALLLLGEPAAALVHYSRAMELGGAQHAWLLGRGKTLEALGRPTEALFDLDAALRLLPDHVETIAYRAVALAAVDRLAEAKQDAQRIASVMPQITDWIFQRAIATSQAGDVVTAVRLLRLVEHCVPMYADLPGLRLHLQMCVANLGDWPITRATVLDRVAAGQRACPPLAFLSISDSADLQRRCAASHVEPSGRSVWNGESYGHDRLRIGYLSADFTEHALTFLLTGVLEHHDRALFEIIGFALRKDERSAAGQRVRAAFDRVVDLEGQPEEAVAQAIRGAEVDVLIEMMGHTSGNSGGVLGRRPAPVQVSYLGYPGTLGHPVADYLIADDYVIPEGARDHYAEAVVYLPDCFQANDERRTVSAVVPDREVLGLADAGWVFCSFHASHKLNPPLLDVWARLLQMVPDSVLWIYVTDEPTWRNLCAEFAARTVDPKRLVAAHRVPYADHLARLPQADLCLDTWPFNGGATTSDALWAGVPVVTCIGESFASRMSGSLLRCLGLLELVATNLTEYERLALEVSRDRERYARIREQLRSAISGPPFDSERHCRQLEAAYLQMHDRHHRGAAPTSFRVQPV